MKGKCLIVGNGYFDNDATVSQRAELIAKLKKYGVAADVIKSNAVPAFIDGGDVKTNVKDYDFCIYLDKDLSVAYMLEKSGLKLFNSAEAIRLCDDKMLTYIALSGTGVKMPKTISSPLMYKEADDPAFLDRVEAEIGYPVVVKKVYGSMGRGVFLAKNRAELEKLFNSLKLYPHLYQEYVGRGFGEDIRVITVGGRVAAAMRRVNENDFRSNIESGGRGETVILTDKQREIAEKVSKSLGLVYAGVDIIGGDVLCEVNSNAFFKGIESVTGIDVADIYAKFLINRVYN